MEKTKFRILEAAQKAGVHVCTLKDLEKQEVIHPERSVAGHRLFTEDDIQKIRKHYQKRISRWMSKVVNDD